MDILPALYPGSLVVVFARHAAKDEISHIIAKLALQGSVTVLDGGNRFQAYQIAHLLRKHTTNVDPISQHLFIRRAFTCYQMLALLEDTPATRQPYLILDLLSTFYDEHVKPHEAHRLLEACLNQINRLCQFAPMAITLGEPKLPERAFLLEKVCKKADKLFIEDHNISQEIQPALF